MINQHCCRLPAGPASLASVEHRRCLPAHAGMCRSRRLHFLYPLLGHAEWQPDLLCPSTVPAGIGRPFHMEFAQHNMKIARSSLHLALLHAHSWEPRTSATSHALPSERCTLDILAKCQLLLARCGLLPCCAILKAGRQHIEQIFACLKGFPHGAVLPRKDR